MDLLEELQTQVLCGDGAIGTMLIEAGIPLTCCFEELCVTEPERIEEIHRQYISAGARVIETNTFGANAVRLAIFGLEGRVVEINHAAAQLANNTARGKNVYVAGSVGPLGISKEDARMRGIDRRRCFQEQITALIEGGVDLIFFETFIDFEEMEIAFRARKEVGAGGSICSFTCAPEGRLSSGMLLEEAFGKLRSLGAEMVGVNCMNGPHDMAQLIQQDSLGVPLAAYPNAGHPEYRAGRFIYHAAPDDFALAARQMIAKGTRLVGGCCGTTPKHVEAIREMIATSEASRIRPGA
jgi:methionine synthase / methylenetetrahydrofolate reductase(NADPH)